MQKQLISKNIQENECNIKQAFLACDDLKMRKISIGKVEALVCYIEVNAGNALINVLGRMLAHLEDGSKEQVAECIRGNAFALSDAEPYIFMEDAICGILVGDAILFVDGLDVAIKMPDQGYPQMGIGKSEEEKVIRGSDESFTESEKANTALIRKRIRNTQLKVKELQVGVRSFTNVALVYVEGLAEVTLVDEIQRRLTLYEIDGVMDSGVLEQLAEESWLSPFPQFQSTRRPDRAAMEVLNGKVVVLVDNSPVALLVPTDVNSFLKTTDDYYNRFFMATFARIIRYVAAFFSLTLPGLYLAVTNFHTQIIPTPLLLSFWEARIGVPFPAAFEVLLMELSFELIREAGVRLPGTMGNTIGIVGGLIIGQAAVEANLVSPIVVIVVAFTALCSFAIPNEEFAFSFRILKFLLIALASWLGFFGFLIGLFFILVHMAGLKSFGLPYLSPYVGPQENGYEDEKDSVVRFPLRMLWKRPVYANPTQRRKLRKRNGK